MPVLPRTRRRRTLLSAVAALAVIGTVLAVSSSAGAVATDGWAYQMPAVGECHQVANKQLDQDSDRTSPVACSQRHDLQVIAVTRMPPNTNWKVTGKDMQRALRRTCLPALHRALGVSYRAAAMSAYTWAFWIPTRAQRAHGASWLRCDAGLWKYAAFAPLGSDLSLRGGPLANTEKNCIVVRRDGYTRSSCASRHNFKAVKAFTVPGKRQPSTKRFQRFANSHCPGRRWYATWTVGYTWASGDHALTCYSRT